MNSYKTRMYTSGMEPISHTTYCNTERLLKLYRRILFRSKRQLAQMQDECRTASHRKLTDYIAVLIEFDSTNQTRRICDRLEAMGSTLCLLEVMEDALSLLLSYPDDGKLYHRILKQSYFADQPMTHEEIMEVEAMSRSTYYRRRADAVETYAVMLWGYSIPKIENAALETQLRQNRDKVGTALVLT